jgi:CcmD family protein
MKIKVLRRLALLLFVVFNSVAAAWAQTETDAPEMADALRQNGKIYVVVVAVAIIVAGMLVYLISLDRKVSRLEKEIKP